MFTTTLTDPLCPIYLIYTSMIDPADRAGWLHMSSLEAQPRGEARWPLAIVRGTEHSDYTGSAVEASNYRMLASDGCLAPHLIRIVGSHGYRALAYDAALGPLPDSPELSDVLEGLQHETMFDEDDVDSLERELQDAAWIDHGLPEFCQALTVVFDRFDADGDHDALDGSALDVAPLPAVASILHALAAQLSFAPTEIATRADALTRLWALGLEVYNLDGYVIEPGRGVYVCISEWIAAAVRTPGDLDLLDLAAAWRDEAAAPADDGGPDEREPNENGPGGLYRIGSAE